MNITNMSVFRYYAKQFEITFEMISNLFRPRRKETLLYFEEIGLTLSVPRFLNVLTKGQLEGRLKKLAQNRAPPATSFATGDDCRQLFIARSAEYYYMSGIMIPLDGRRPIDAKNEYYEFEHYQVNELRDRYKKYAKVVVEERSVGRVIAGVDFEKSEITVRVPEEVLYSVYYYHGFHKGYHILLSAAFSGERRGMELVESIEKARFS
jgi:hypothetical protein